MNLRARLMPPGWKVFWVLLGLGLLLRMYTMIFYTPTVFNYYGGDSARFMRLEFVGLEGVFGDGAQPATYPLFLAVLREFSNWLPLTTMVQHLLGLTTAAALYAAVVRVGAPRWAGTIPAVVVLFSGDQLFLEHGILTEALWMPMLALAMYCLARAVSTANRQWWLVAGGAALACSALVRNVSQALVPLLTAWAVFALAGPARARIRQAAAVLVPALVVIGCYVVVAKPIAGGYTGLTEYGGLQLYGRVAQFADCQTFTPPHEVRALCVDAPSQVRPGPFYWTFSDSSPLRTQLKFDGHDRETLALMGEFGRDAIWAQPADYAQAVAKDVVRFFAPDVGTPRPDSGTDAYRMSFESIVPTAQGASLEKLAVQFRERYTGVGDGTASSSVRVALGAYQSTFRVHGLLMLIMIGLASTGWLLGRGAMRAGAALFLLSGLALLVLPPVVWSYDVRYAIPPTNLFAAGAAIGVAVLVSHMSSGHARRLDSAAQFDSA